MHTEFMAFVSNEDTAASIRSWAAKQGFPQDTVRVGGPEMCSQMLESNPPPKLTLVDFEGVEEASQMASKLVGQAGIAATMIGLGVENDVSLYRNLIAAGFNDYLVKPLTPEILTATMTAAARGEVGPGALKDAKNIVVIGVRGGVGASTIVTNLSWLLAHTLKKKTAILDLDLQFGTTALALDVEPGHGLRDVVSSPQRVDSLMIAGAIISESDDLELLSAEESIEENVPVDANAITALLKEMRTNYQTIIVDLPRYMLSSQKRVLATAHEIILVTEVSLVGIRDSLRIRTLLKGLGCAARITQVATQISSDRPAAVDDATFAKGAQGPIDFVIPDDHKNLVAASNAGKMLGELAPSAPITKKLLELASHLLGSEEAKEEPKKEKGLLSSLFGGDSKKQGKTDK